MIGAEYEYAGLGHFFSFLMLLFSMVTKGGETKGERITTYV